MNKTLSIGFMLFLFAALVFTITFGNYQKEQASLALIANQQAILDQRNDLASIWVYEHSSKISMEVAREIVGSTLQYKNALLLLSIFEVESNFLPSATSSKGARGLGQIHWPSHGKTLIGVGICKTERDLYDVKTNIAASALLLKDMLERSKGDVVAALRLYLGGRDGAYTMRILNNFVQLSLLVAA